ncbi:MAG: hypothetical protein ABW171_08055 [Steroidobacter sp.]
MRLVSMLLATLGVLALVIWARQRIERPELILAGQGSPRIETEQERWQWQRDFYLKLYPRLGEVLQIDAKTESSLYDLLATQALNVRGGDGAPADLQDQVATEKDRELEKLLGERAFQRFDVYRSMPAAGDVSRLNATFEEAERIRGEALWQLAKTIHENSIYGVGEPATSPSYETLEPEVAGSPRSQALIMVAQQQYHFRMQEGWRKRIETEAASFLTPTQLDALKRSHAETSASFRRSMESTRKEVGLTPTIPDTPEETLLGIIRRRMPVEGEIVTKFTVTVNDEPVHIERAVPNRQRFGFQAGSGLWIEAIPTLYQDGWFELLLAYFETRRGKLRQLDQWVVIGSPTREPNGAPSAPHDAGTDTQWRGRIEYKIRPTGITASAVERR